MATDRKIYTPQEIEAIIAAANYTENEARYGTPSLIEWMDNLPDGDESTLFEDSLAARYPLINRECPFNTNSDFRR